MKPNHVKLDTLRSCLSGLSQDSGLGSSQEFPSLALDQIVVPEHLTRKATKRTFSESSSISTEEETTSKEKSDATVIPEKKAKRLLEEQTNTDVKEEPLQKVTTTTITNERLDKLIPEEVIEKKEEVMSKTEIIKKESNSISNEDVIEKRNKLITKEEVEKSDSERSVEQTAPELCILCNNGPKNSIFLHGNKAHMCCCYKCAIKTWKASKRCPICSCKVKNVVKVFTI